MLTPHRRHRKGCPHRDKGWNFTLCDCPVWADGMLHGQRVTRSLQTNNWERAVLRIQELERGATSPEIHAAVPTLGKAAEAFLSVQSERNLRQSTIDGHTITLKRLKKSIGATRSIASIELETLEAFLAGSKLGPRSRCTYIQRFRAFFAWCVERRWLGENPAKRLRKPAAADVPTLPFTPDEVQALINACSQIKNTDDTQTAFIRGRARALVYTLLYSGLRISDVATLRRSALDDSGHLTLRTMKTGTPLSVLLHPEAVKTLNALPAYPGSPYFFWTGRGSLRTCTGNLRLTITRLGKLAKVHAHPHRFRDTFAVELLSKGADIRTVQMLLGHKSVKTTEAHYAHFVAAHQALLDSATAKLDFRPKPARPLLVHPLKHRKRNAK